MPSTRIAEFDTWRPGYGGATVRVEIAGTDTLASIFTDEDLTVAATNPQVLASETFGGVDCGKFQAPLYIGVAYTLKINGIDETGVARVPLTTLIGEDASLATVQVAGGNQDIELEDHLARRIDVRDFGLFVIVGGPGASSSTNNATLVAAIAAAAAAGGGYVEVPAGTYEVTNFTVSAGVVLRGQGRGVTTLQSIFAGAVGTVSGTLAGFERITIDGVSLVATSIGVVFDNQDHVHFQDVEVKRFETGVDHRGGSHSIIRNVFVSTCVTGYKAKGSSTFAHRANHWIGGTVEFSTTIGLDIEFSPGPPAAGAEWNTYSDILFDTNTGIAVKIVGARHTEIRDCRWRSNTTNLNVADGSPATTDNTIIGLEITGGDMSTGAVALSGTLQDVAFRRIEISNVTITLTVPSNNILLEDCTIATNVTIAGTTTAVIRKKTGNRGSTTLTTSGATPTVAWSMALAPGQIVYLEAKVAARGLNTTNSAFYHIAVSARRNGNTLNYDAQTANFTNGNQLTGATSGATALILTDTDAGATGALELANVVGTFLDNEIINDGAGGSATANGVMIPVNAALRGGVTAIRAAVESDASWDATFAANGLSVELQVTGAAIVEWVADVDVVAKL